VAVLFTLTLFVSAFLLFLVQPMLARMVLPLLGGTPAVWNTCMVFFQAMLLAGYAYAHAAPAWLGTRRQSALHVGLLLLPLFALPIALPADRALPDMGNPVPALLALLLVTVGLPFFVIATNGPLLQRWFAATGHRRAHDPYFLYAASNLGSMIALLGYPFLFEPRFGLAEQTRLWAIGYAVLAVLVTACAAISWRSPPAAVALKPDEPTPAANLISDPYSEIDNGGITREPISQAPVVAFTDGLTPGPSQPEQSPPPSLSPTPPSVATLDGRVTALRRMRWVILAFVPSSLMLSVTTYLTTDIASIPLLWVLPLSLYLLTFILAFSRRQMLPLALVLRWMPLVVLLILIVLLSKGTEPPVNLLISIHLLGLFWVSLACHGLLAADRPSIGHLTEFYLWLSVGGVIGGLFNALLAPLLFKSILEYPIVLVLACLLRPSPTVDSQREGLRRGLDLALPIALGLLTAGIIVGCRAAGVPPGRLSVALMFAAPVVLCYTFAERPLRFGLGVAAVLVASNLYPGLLGEVIYSTRSFFGVHRVTIDPTGQFHVLAHGNTIHGQQSIDPERRSRPLTYYHITGPVGHLFAALGKDPRLNRVGIIGLGSGTMATYAWPGQHWTYFEIDPAVARIAQDRSLFTFYGDALDRGVKLDTVFGDARLTLERTTDRFGMIVIDAFSSDAIPVHLLTREALKVYFSRLETGGFLTFNISNRYLDLEPVLAELARDAGAVCLLEDDRYFETQNDKKNNKNYPDTSEAHKGKTRSQWAVMARQEKDLPRVRGKGGVWTPLTPKTGLPVWTDDYSNLFQVFRSFDRSD
jgi:hypothetical protein